MIRLRSIALLLSTMLVGCSESDAEPKELAARRVFLEGNAAFAKSEEAERASKQPNADPTTLEFAIVRAEDAVAFWRKAAVTRNDWPEARRNVERGLLLLKRLRAEQADKNKKPDNKPSEPPDAKPVPPPDGTPDLTPEQVMKLFEVLQEKEKQKLVARRADRKARSIDVEKDW